jgi:hypothetical protein
MKVMGSGLKKAAMHLWRTFTRYHIIEHWNEMGAIGRSNATTLRKVLLTANRVGNFHPLGSEERLVPV